MCRCSMKIVSSGPSLERLLAELQEIRDRLTAIEQEVIKQPKDPKPPK